MPAGPARKSRRHLRVADLRGEPENTPLPAPLPGLSLSGPLRLDALPKASPAARKGPPPPPRPRRVHAQQAPLPPLHELGPAPAPEPEPEERTLQVALPARLPRWVRSWLMLAFGAGLVVAIFWGGRRPHRAPPPAPPAPPAAQPSPPRAASVPLRVESLPSPLAPPPAPLDAPRPGARPAAQEAPARPPARPAPPEPERARERGSRGARAPERQPPQKGPPKAAPAEAPLQPVPVLTREILRATLMRAEPGLRACVREGWGTDATLGLSVSPAGQVRRAEVAGPVAGTETGTCIEGKLRALRFPPSQQGADKQLFWSFHLPEPGAGREAATRGKPRSDRR